MNGLPSKGSFSLAAKGTTPSVTITPVAAPVLLQSATTGYVANIAGGSSADGAPLIQYPRFGTWNEQWRITPLDDSASGESSIVNPSTGKCLEASGSGQTARSSCSPAPASQASAGGRAPAATARSPWFPPWTHRAAAAWC